MTPPEPTPSAAPFGHAEISRALVIAHIVQSYELGGAEQLALDLASWQRRAGHRVLVIATEGTGPRAAQFEAAGVRAFTIKKGPGLDPSLSARLLARLRAERVDVMHTHTQQPLVYGGIVGFLSRTPLIHTMHGVEPGEGARLHLRRTVGRFPDAFVTVSRSVLAHARKQREAPEKRLHLIENGIDLTRFDTPQTTRAEVRAALGIAPDAWVVTTVARLVPVKRQSRMLYAMAPLLTHGAALLFCGEGPDEGALRALADTLGVADRVLFLGGRTDVPRVLAASDVFALSSDSEGLPLSILEAMATGLPVVATAVGSVATIIEEGASGWATPPGEAAPLREKLASLQADRALGIAMGRRGRAIANERYSLDTMAHHYMALYAQALRGS